MKRHVLGVLTIALLAAAAFALVASTAEAASTGDWKRAMVAANEQLEQPVTIHPDLDFTNTWDHAARATAWRLSSRLPGVATSARLTNALKAFLRPYRPYRDYEPAMNRWKKAMRSAKRQARKWAKIIGVKVPKRLLAPITNCYLPYDRNCGEYDFEAWAYVYRKRTLALRRYAKQLKVRLAKAKRGVPRASARWAPLVSRYFAKYLHRPLGVRELRRLLWVIHYESGGNPRDVYCGHYGLFQCSLAHFRGRDPYRPVSNIATAAMLYAQNGTAPWAATWGRACRSAR